ncbi:hypothetical protein BV22DRAFT_1103082 [Leucogyrophana mollusca]|uniref:Uncharacterized protein n=1 Tax=Leucogyrophana mollusca TaxID=85980 RepID=A0ACB8BSB8_9AGAM|nr:hypothetical protein BV22DRAFT_1103082 [Leucogyrophana mollusca]
MDFSVIVYKISRQIKGRVPFFVHYGPLGILLAAIVLLLAIALKITIAYLNSNNLYQVTIEDAVSRFGVSGVPGVAQRLANLFSVDLDSQTFLIHWSIVGACGQAYTNSSNDSCIQNHLMIPMALYLNENATINWNTSTPIGTYDPSTIRYPPPVSYFSNRSMIPAQEFDTVIPMDPFLPYTQQKKYSTLFYPFDQFTTFISLLAIDPQDNSTIPISGVVGFGNMVNWEGYSTFYATSIGQDTLYSLSFTARRQRMIKAFVFVIVITNWILSLTVLWMTILVLFRAKIDSGIILASTTVLFALPQIRASMPNSPPFDIAGYFMNVCLVSACTSILLFSQLRYHYRPLVTTSMYTRPKMTREEREAFLVDTDL